MTDEAAGLLETMTLRYAGTCRVCGLAILAGTRAGFDRPTKTVVCTSCIGEVTGELDFDRGTAGASALREFERRKVKRETRIREAHPRLGGAILALTDDPQSTRAWATGARGESLVGQRLDKLRERGLHVLHDRLVPGTKANIDHIVVGPRGVFVIDAKRYREQRPTLQVEGGIFRPRTEKLMIGSRDGTKLVAGVLRQVGDVRAVLDRVEAQHVSVRGMLCFVEADWPPIGGSFEVGGVDVLWPRKAVDLVTKVGPLSPADMEPIARQLAAHFPTA